MNNLTKIIVQVILDKPLKEAFDYIWEETQAGIKPSIGMIVEAPFGRASVVGIVIGVSAHSNIEPSKLKSVKALAPLPCLDKKIL